MTNSRMPVARRRAVRVDAPAKLNLYLHVLGRRADGYHRLDSLVVFADVGDSIEAHTSDDLTLAIDGPFAAGLASEPDNLVLRAARALAETAGRPAGAALRLTKRLPVASGIGGGSADAAACLRALIELWQLELDPASLAGLALDLGADVPVCMGGVPSLVAGIGERLAPAPNLPPVWVVLANPGVAVSTAAVFDALDGGYSKPAPIGSACGSAEELRRQLSARTNDLEIAARRIEPAIGEVLGALADLPDCLLARMSGSGATCFALFAEPTTARGGAAKLSADCPGWWVVAAPILGCAAGG